VYPSRYEGFGFPVLEAMANRCPVITTNTSSLPEVVGDAGVLVPPGDSQAIADAMQRLMADHVFTERLRDEGYRRSQLFRWGSVAEATWRVWDRLLQGDQAAQRAQVSVVQSSASVSLH
jgi:glycosyltransferase involved in cell wall biosynthesis